MRPLRTIFLTGLLALSASWVYGQAATDSLSKAVSKSYGKEKLILLHALTQEYFDSNDTKKAVKSARQATALAEQIINSDNELIQDEDLVLKSTSYFNMGKAFYKNKDFDYAKKYFQLAIKSSLELHRFDHIQDSENYIARIDAREPEKGKFFSKLKEFQYGVTDQIIKSSSDLNLSATLKLARSYEAKENYPKAIEKYEVAVNMLKDMGESDQVIQLNEHIALLHQKEGDYEKAIASYEEISEIKEVSGDSSGLVASRDSINQLQQIIDDSIGRVDLMQDAIKPRITTVIPQSKGVPDNSEALRVLAQKAEQDEDYEQSLSYYKLYQEANARLQQEEYNRELALLEQTNEIEIREKTIALLQQEKELQDVRLAQNDAELQRQARYRNSLIIGSLLIASLAITLYLLYRNKRRAHNKLSSAYNDLNDTQHKLSDAEKKIKNLLRQQVSNAVAQELLSEGKGGKITQKFVCVMFLDIRGFTPFAERKAPEDIIQYQNDVFGFMIEIIEKNHGIINQFLGDGFMATFGAPVSSGNDCQNAYRSAVEIVNQLEDLNNNNKIPHTKVGIGLHAGPVVAGNVGTEDRKQYSITGNTVILASRIEQLNKQFDSRLIISEDVYQHLENTNELKEQYEEVMVKGRSEPIRILKVA